MTKNILVNQVIIWSKEKQINASSKARKDVETILKDKEFDVVELKIKASKFPPLRAWRKHKAFMHAIKDIEQDKNVWFQYPTYFAFITLKIIAHRLKKKNCTIHFIIHDVESIRYGRNIKEDINNLNVADHIIAHTDNMKQILVKNGVTTKIDIMGLFPYLAKDSYKPIEEVLSIKDTIAFAGNLSKSVFLRHLMGIDFSYAKFCFYGAECNLDFNKRMQYMGRFSPDNVSAISAGWGLVWDGDSAETCSGKLGEYLMYNSPHKLSLYVAAGIPVIIWDKSAFCDLVNKKNIGICISSLSEIDQRLKTISEEDYLTKLNNVRGESKILRKGGGFAQIVEQYT